jgi:hypothetical protein
METGRQWLKIIADELVKPSVLRGGAHELRLRGPIDVAAGLRGANVGQKITQDVCNLLDIIPGDLLDAREVRVRAVQALVSGNQ